MSIKREKPACIYGIRCAYTERIYIGCTSNLRLRLQKHFRELRQHYKTGKVYNLDGEKERIETVWQQDYNKYGEGAFEIYVLEEEVSPEDCDARETYWIEKYRSDNPDYGYNLKKELPEEFDIRLGLPPVPEFEEISCG